MEIGAQITRAINAVPSGSYLHCLADFGRMCLLLEGICYVRQERECASSRTYILILKPKPVEVEQIL